MSKRTSLWRRMIAATLLCGAAATSAHAQLQWDWRVDDAGQQIQAPSKDVTHGVPILIRPQGTHNGTPIAWPTNATGIFWYQTGPAMAKSNQWWSVTNGFDFAQTVTVLQKTTVPVVTTSITNATTFTYGTNGVVNGTNLVTTTVTVTNNLARYTNVSILDTGRVQFAWSPTNDFMQGQGSYNCWIGVYSNTTLISLPFAFTMNMKQSPGWVAYNAAVPSGQAWVTGDALTALLAGYPTWAQTTNIVLALGAGTAAEAALRALGDTAGTNYTDAQVLAERNRALAAEAVAATNLTAYIDYLHSVALTNWGAAWALAQAQNLATSNSVPGTVGGILATGTAARATFADEATTAQRVIQPDTNAWVTVTSGTATLWRVSTTQDVIMVPSVIVLDSVPDEILTYRGNGWWDNGKQFGRVYATLNGGDTNWLYYAGLGGFGVGGCFPLIPAVITGDYAGTLQAVGVTTTPYYVGAPYLVTNTFPLATIPGTTLLLSEHNADTNAHTNLLAAVNVALTNKDSAVAWLTAQNLATSNSIPGTVGGILATGTAARATYADAADSATNSHYATTVTGPLEAPVDAGGQMITNLFGIVFRDRMSSLEQFFTLRVKGHNLTYEKNGDAITRYVWTQDKQGAGTGMDADMLDGYHAEWFAWMTDLAGYLPIDGSASTLSDYSLGVPGLIASSNAPIVATVNAIGGTQAVNTSAIAGLQNATNCVTFSASGNLATSTGQARWYPARSISLLDATASVGTAPVGASVLCAVCTNGVSIATATIADGATVGGDQSLSNVVLSATDYLTINITQVGSTISGAYLTMRVRYK